MADIACANTPTRHGIAGAAHADNPSLHRNLKVTPRQVAAWRQMSKTGCFPVGIRTRRRDMRLLMYWEPVPRPAAILHSEKLPTEAVYRVTGQRA
jgi:hypothetical protein